MVKKNLRLLVLAMLAVFGIIFLTNVMSANSYLGDVYFTVPNTVYVTGEQIEIKGYVYESNYTANGTLVSSSSGIAGVYVNLTITNVNGTHYSNYSLVTDANGTFYSKSNFYSSATQINAPSAAGYYNLMASYTDANNTLWFSYVEISVVNQSIDLLRISSAKAKYNSLENVDIEVEAIKLINDRILHVSNVSVNGSLRNSSKASLLAFNCTTGDNGKCIVSITAPSTYGDYILELNNFKAFGGFSVVPFSVNVYMKDDLGQSLKNIYAIGEQGRIEVSVLNATTADTYSFSGYIADSAGNNIKNINSTDLNSNNSFANTFLFTVDATQFSYGSYTAYVTVAKTGDGSVSMTTSFEVKDWSLAVNKKSSNSGFEYAYSIFANKTMNFEAYPAYRSNGSVIKNITSSSWTVNLKDSLNNVVSLTNVSWNSSCGNEGCYQFSLASPVNTGQYNLQTTLSYSGVSQIQNIIINVIDGVMSAQSTDKDGSLKELFGTNEFVYISLTNYNSTSAGFNLSDAEIFAVEFMNGTEFSYAEVNNFSSVNSSNSVNEWAWNSSLQRIKLDVPKIGGLYNLFLLGNNQTLGTAAKFIVNPYDVCSIPKDTPGQAGGSTGYYYVWQFKTTDTIYFEMKLTQANNPLGKATALNSSGNTTGADYTGCTDESSTKQVVSNATISVLEVKNMESGALQALNATASTCQAEDSSGGYTCTVKSLSRWEGGASIVKFNIAGQDGTTSIAYSRFEARAFYLYGWSQQWQNSPASNISLNVQMYEAGNGWWGSSSGLSGTVTLKKIEYQGRDGEWIWPPVDYGYNVSAVNASSVTGSTGTISIPASNAPGGVWKTGYYRAVLQGTTTAGDTDYGYAWFGIKLWDVYGQPVECTALSCQYKNYFNSKDNISLYVKISNAGSYSYSYSGGQDIGGNVSISVKKIEDCRKWPCKELNASQYQASSIIVNASSPWYWNANINNHSNYIIQINSTAGTWGTGYYSVVLDVNGTDTGHAWFNTIAFYASVRPTDFNGTNYKSSIKPAESMYFNVTTTKDYKGWYANYNLSDFVNTTVDDIVLRTWNQITWQSVEYNYPEDINITPLTINGSVLVNVTYNNGSWPTGYYNGELTLKNSENETSSGYLWFSVKPFRVNINRFNNNYNFDSDSCVNTTINIYEPGWYSDTFLYGNYSVVSVYENVWSGYSMNIINYTNFTSGSFNATGNITFCPNNGTWGSGSWDGHHSLNVVIKDNSLNDSEQGWVSFKAVPFQVSWSSVGSKLTNADIDVSAALTKYSSGANASGNLTYVYQWRYDNYMSTKEEYVFSVGNCYSNVSGQCTVNGTQNVTIYAPSGGWRVGYNYLTAEWTEHDDASSVIRGGSSIYFDGREAYNGYFSNTDANGWWKYEFRNNENITIKLYARDMNYNSVDVNITSVSYAFSGDSCWDDWCRSYTAVSASGWSLVEGGVATGSDGAAVINIQVPSGGWSKGYYYIKAGISGSSGTAVVKDGSIRIKDFTAPNVSISSPAVNLSVNGSTFSFNATTTENANCYVTLFDYGSFYRWHCPAAANASNSSNSTATPGLTESCNMTKYGFSNSTTYYYEYLSKDYISVSSGANYDYWWQSGSTGMVTDLTVHGYVFNTSNKVTGSNLFAQDYAINVWCYDSDWNYGNAYAAFSINATG